VRVLIEQELDGDRVTLEDLESFVEAVRAATSAYMHPGLRTIEINYGKLSYESEK
jgi:hypothetical protein